MPGKRNFLEESRRKHLHQFTLKHYPIRYKIN